MLIAIDVESLMPVGELEKLSGSVLRQLGQVLAEVARVKWIQLAGEKLHKTSQDYIRAIQEVTTEGDVFSVVLAGQWPNMLEDGFSPYDMRETLLGPNVPVVGAEGGRGKRMTKSGHYYRTIFFRMMGPSATGRNAQKVTDAYAQYLGKSAAEQLGRAAWRAMKKLGASTSSPGGKTQWGGRLPAGAVTDERGRSHVLVSGSPDVAGVMRGGVQVPAGTLIRHGGAEHKTDLFAGAVKMQQKYKNATQSTFGTFRTISTAVSDGWIHPGFSGAHLAPEAARAATAMLPALMERLTYGMRRERG